MRESFFKILNHVLLVSFLKAASSIFLTAFSLSVAERDENFSFSFSCNKEIDLFRGKT